MLRRLSVLALVAAFLVGCDDKQTVTDSDIGVTPTEGTGRPLAADAPLPGGRDRAATTDQLHADVRRRVEAMYGGDAETVVRTTSPKVVESLGEEAMRQALQEQLDMLQQYTQLLRVEFEEQPVFASVSNRIYARVPFVVITRSEEGGEIRNPNYALAILEPGQDSFAFVEGTTSAKRMKELYPDLPSELGIR